MAPVVDLVVVLRPVKRHGSNSKPALHQLANSAEAQYTRLVAELRGEGLQVTARSGEEVGEVLIFVKCSEGVLRKHFLSRPSPSERIQLVYNIVTGLGITPRSAEWDMVDTVMCLHDADFNQKWLHTYTSGWTFSAPNSKIVEQFGPQIALYFSFLRSYTSMLAVPAFIGIISWLSPTRYASYSPTYSVILTLWSIICVEVWRVHDGGAATDEADTETTFVWWRKDLRRTFTFPLLLLSAVFLSAFLTSIFVLEAFVTQLYTGPAHQAVSLAPTLIFAGLVPQFMSAFGVLAQKMTRWELGAAGGEEYEEERTKKVWAMSALVAYLGLALSAFVYIPFGDGLMALVHAKVLPFLALDQDGHRASAMFAASSGAVKLNSKRLEDQMFAYTVTGQISNTFVEVGLPFIMRAVTAWRNGKNTRSDSSSPKKRVAFATDRPAEAQEHERAFLDQVKAEVALPAYDLFGEYSEMVTQFGYVVVWSAIWPLAGVMAFLNNVVEVRGDAMKIAVHTRRPIPHGSGKGGYGQPTMGGWLDALGALTWFGAVVNATLVYMFHPWKEGPASGEVKAEGFAADLKSSGMPDYSDTLATMQTALLVALAASHVFLFVRRLIRHCVRRLAGEGYLPRGQLSPSHRKKDVDQEELEELDVGKEKWNNEDAQWGTFWEYDEGVSEIRRIVKEA